jgi:signal transduction histidine kinase
MNVLGRTVSEQEAERRRITRELHDNVGQSVTLLQLGLGSLEHCPTAGCELAKKAAALKDVTRRMSVDLHRLAWEIRPAALDDLGIETAINQLAMEWGSHSELKFNLQMSLGDRRLPPEVESALYRVVQEAINNVVRHARARQIGIILEVRNNEVTCIIEDDGCGIPSAQLEASHATKQRLGLLGMRERLALIRGSLEVESSDDGGTTLFARVPL